MKKRLFLIGTALMLVQELAVAGTIKFCGVAWPPFTYVERKKISSGISYDILQEAFKRLNMTWQADALPWTRCEKMVLDGKYDAMIDNANLPSFIFGKHPNGSYPLAIYVLDSHPETEFSWEMMRKQKVGMVLGYDYTPKVRAFKHWIPDYTNSDEKVLKKLKAKRYKYALVDIFSAPILAKKLKLNIRALNPRVDSAPSYIVFNKKHQELMRAYDQTFGQMRDDGTLDAIYKRHSPYTYKDLMQDTP